MKVQTTMIPGVLVIDPDVYGDERGYFAETWNAERYAEHGVPQDFRQDSLSLSTKGVLRGLHMQMPRLQGKLVYVLKGEVFDVAADVRRGSPTFGRWVGTTVSAENHRQIWIPPGLAHGFLVTSDEALFAYKSSDVYDPQGQVAIRWDDPDIGIEWPDPTPRLSPRDADAPLLGDLDPDLLPRYEPYDSGNAH